MYKQSRRSGPKVKTGCKTCKIRRIKCDEGQPSCLKCTSTGRCCDGYTSPKGDFQVQVWSRQQAHSPQRPISLLSGFDGSVRYLEYYHHSAWPILSNSFDSKFWSRTTLQMAHAEPAVRHALIALAYLHSTEDGSIRHARSKFASQHESGFLLSHYNKSVRGLVDRIGEASYSHEIGLVTCLLFVCMEFLRGNYHTAFTHLTNGLKIIFGYQGEVRHDSPFSSPSRVPETSSSESQVSFGKSTLIETELKPMFVRAMTSALMYGVNVESSIPTPCLHDYHGLTFTNVREAQQSVHELRNQSILQVYRISRSLYYTPELDLTPDERAQQRTVLSCQRAWYTALQRFRQEHKLSKTDELAISIMLIHYHSVNICTICAPQIRQTAFDDYLEVFKLIVHHARLVLDSMDLISPQNAAWFTFEVSVIPTLYWVGTRCRCPTTRREAVSLLARNPPREGLWDAAQHAVVARRVIELEEKEVDPTTGWPVEHTRMWSCVISADMDQKGGFWAYFVPIGWLHERTHDGKPKALSEFFVMDDKS